MSVSVERDTLQTVGGALLLFAALAGVTDATLRSFAPLLGLLGGVLGHELADDLYDLPDGTGWVVYGLGAGVAGVVLAFDSATWVGGLLTAAGAWAVLDGATMVRYGQVRSTHEFASGAEDEAVRRMLVLNGVYRTLQESDRPQTAERLADSCDLTQSRVDSALDYLEHRDQVARTGERYRAKQQTWGRMTPVARGLAWVPRRVVQPVERLRRHTRGRPETDV